MPRPASADRTSPMTFSIPASLQDRLRDYTARNPKNGNASVLVRKLLVEFLDKQEGTVVAVDNPVAPGETYTVFNGGLPAGISPSDWAELAAGSPLPAPQESALDFVKAHVKPNANLSREQMREEMRRRDPEGYKRMQEEHEARLKAALGPSDP